MAYSTGLCKGKDLAMLSYEMMKTSMNLGKSTNVSTNSIYSALQEYGLDSVNSSSFFDIMDESKRYNVPNETMEEIDFNKYDNNDMIYIDNEQKITYHNDYNFGAINGSSQNDIYWNQGNDKFDKDIFGKNDIDIQNMSHDNRNENYYGNYQLIKVRNESHKRESDSVIGVPNSNCVNENNFFKSNIQLNTEDGFKMSTDICGSNNIDIKHVRRNDVQESVMSQVDHSLGNMDINEKVKLVSVMQGDEQVNDCLDVGRNKATMQQTGSCADYALKYLSPSNSNLITGCLSNVPGDYNSNSSINSNSFTYLNMANISHETLPNKGSNASKFIHNSLDNETSNCRECIYLQKVYSTAANNIADVLSCISNNTNSSNGNIPSTNMAFIGNEKPYNNVSIPLNRTEQKKTFFLNTNNILTNKSNTSVAAIDCFSLLKLPNNNSNNNDINESGCDNSQNNCNNSNNYCNNNCRNEPLKCAQVAANCADNHKFVTYKGNSVENAPKCTENVFTCSNIAHSHSIFNSEVNNNFNQANLLSSISLSLPEILLNKSAKSISSASIITGSASSLEDIGPCRKAYIKNSNNNNSRSHSYSIDKNDICNNRNIAYTSIYNNLGSCSDSIQSSSKSIINNSLKIDEFLNEDGNIDISHLRGSLCDCVSRLNDNEEGEIISDSMLNDLRIVNQYNQYIMGHTKDINIGTAGHIYTSDDKSCTNMKQNNGNSKSISAEGNLMHSKVGENNTLFDIYGKNFHNRNGSIEKSGNNFNEILTYLSSILSSKEYCNNPLLQSISKYIITNLHTLKEKTASDGIDYVPLLSSSQGEMATIIEPQKESIKNGNDNTFWNSAYLADTISSNVNSNVESSSSNSSNLLPSVMSLLNSRIADCLRDNNNSVNCPAKPRGPKVGHCSSLSMNSKSDAIQQLKSRMHYCENDDVACAENLRMFRNSNAVGYEEEYNFEQHFNNVNRNSYLKKSFGNVSENNEQILHFVNSSSSSVGIGDKFTTSREFNELCQHSSHHVLQNVNSYAMNMNRGGHFDFINTNTLPEALPMKRHGNDSDKRVEVIGNLPAECTNYDLCKNSYRTFMDAISSLSLKKEGIEKSLMKLSQEFCNLYLAVNGNSANAMKEDNRLLINRTDRINCFQNAFSGNLDHSTNNNSNNIYINNFNYSRLFSPHDLFHTNSQNFHTVNSGSENTTWEYMRNKGFQQAIKGQNVFGSKSDTNKKGFDFRNELFCGKISDKNFSNDSDFESDAEKFYKEAEKTKFREEWSFPWTKGLLRFMKYVKIAEKIQLCRPNAATDCEKSDYNKCVIKVLKRLRNPYTPPKNQLSQKEQWPRFGIRIQIICGGYVQDILAWSNCSREDFQLAMPVLEKAINTFLLKVGGVDKVRNGHNPFFNACRNGFNKCPYMRERFKHVMQMNEFVTDDHNNLS